MGVKVGRLGGRLGALGLAAVLVSGCTGEDPASCSERCLEVDVLGKKGELTIDATTQTDYPVLMGVLLITSLIVVLANLIADVTYAVVDPRIKY